MNSAPALAHGDLWRLIARRGEDTAIFIFGGDGGLPVHGASSNLGDAVYQHFSGLHILLPVHFWRPWQLELQRRSFHREQRLFNVGAAKQDGARFDAELNVALEEDGSREKFAVIENDRSAAGRVTRVDGLLDRGGVERLAVPNRAVLGNVADRGVS